MFTLSPLFRYPMPYRRLQVATRCLGEDLLDASSVCTRTSSRPTGSQLQRAGWRLRDSGLLFRPVVLYDHRRGTVRGPWTPRPLTTKGEVRALSASDFNPRARAAIK